ncbi:pyruvate kinase [Methylotuvimicrobium buryatense]|uniref:pyruvate kinase n=1 Tax=Methylotuvimicrobium buryatense TaxID=95641 RepID=A0A4P9URP8_METBY|nr:pyruvate kinase [Methylotuvimicrobium buryatense]QCW83170.1 pyruvate kinase [Methylotuvimicrobium buryatense]
MTTTAKDHSFPFDNDPYREILSQLLQDIAEIRHKVGLNAEKRLQNYTQYYRSGVLTKSASNLAHYLALRQFDLRHLQERLAQAGLSSLGRAESSVMSTLDTVIDLLHRALDPGYQAIGKNPSELGFNRGQQLLDQHTVELFGSHFENSKAHVMVTLASEAAWDYKLIKALLSKGMTCARINCAHDEPIIWHSMIRNIRRAEVEIGRDCRILMDLAGHKIRTGPIELGPAIHHIKVKRDAYGNVVEPGRIVLFDAACSEPLLEGEDTLFRVAIPTELFKVLAAGHRLGFVDARGKQRMLTIEKPISEQAWLACCGQPAFLPSGCDLTWMPPIAENENIPEVVYRLGEFSGAPKLIKVFKDDFLLLTDHGIDGAPAQYDESGVPIKPAQIGCTLSSAISKLQPTQAVWIDDGKVGAVVDKLTEAGVLLKITHARSNGVTIRSDKGINFPETELDLPALSDKDREDLNFACTHADMIGFSFVESLADMECLIEELAQRGATDLPIIAKIETNRAVRNLPEIILGTIGRHSLGIMIARGDLAVELGSARLAEIQEELLWLCEAAHVPVIWATQVLETIAKKGAKSRPEFTDAAMAVRAECVMLNKGPYILDALQALINVMIRMQEHQRKKFPILRALHW